jgi:hypothetical protein
MRFRTRRAWKNHACNQVVEPRRIYEPCSPEEIGAIVREAERGRATVRADGWALVV